MKSKKFKVNKYFENDTLVADIMDFYVRQMIEMGKDIDDVTIEILYNNEPMTYKECVNLLNKYDNENEITVILTPDTNLLEEKKNSLIDKIKVVFGMIKKYYWG